MSEMLDVYSEMVGSGRGGVVVRGGGTGLVSQKQHF